MDVYECKALHGGREGFIVQRPILTPVGAPRSLLPAE